MGDMERNTDKKIPTVNVPILILCFSISILASSLMYLSYHLSNSNKGTIAIPAGQTYLGPPEVVPSWTNFSPATPTDEPKNQPSLFVADPKTPWTVWVGKTYPYRFSYPNTLTLTGFPHDPMDSVGISWGGKKPQENILINVIDLSKNASFEPYIKQSKKQFVDAWWKQFSGLTGNTPVEKFTNKKGLVGYKTRFINKGGQTPNLDIFFEVPKKPGLMIRIANGILDPSVFDVMVESVEWKTR